MPEKEEIRIVPEKVIDVAQAIAHNTTIIKRPPMMRLGVGIAQVMKLHLDGFQDFL